MWRRGLLLVLMTAGLLVEATPAVAAPELQLSPGAGAAGETVTVTGTGFAAAEVEIRWGAASGELLATATGPDFSAVVTVPDVRPNSYPVVAVVRQGSAVSTSNASFQVTPAVENTATIATTPGVREAVTAPNRGAGIDGGLPDTTNGDEAPPPTSATVPVTTPATTPTSAAPAVTVATAVPTTVVATPDTAVAAAPVAGSNRSTSTVAGGSNGTAGAGEERGSGALRPASTSQSSGAVDSPALVVVGLGIAFAGTMVLAVRSRRTSGGQ